MKKKSSCFRGIFLALPVLGVGTLSLQANNEIPFVTEMTVIDSQSNHTSGRGITSFTREVTVGNFVTYGETSFPLLVSNIQISVRGKVVDENGEGLPGVTVRVKETSQGTVTDLNGNFTITVPDSNAILVFSFVGYSSQEVTVGNRSVIDVSLSPDLQSLEEVVVVGYGTQNKESLTGAVSTIKAENVVRRPVSSTTQALQGLAPGLTVVDQGGSPGADGANVNIRGISNFDGTGPLYVVDGIPQDFNQIDPNDIASISVLKDASAAAIYGSRAANGVILVTTKRGSLGKSSISYNGYAGIQRATRLPERVGIGDYLNLVNEAYENSGRAPKYSEEYIQNTLKGDEPLKYPDTDWYDVIFDPAWQQSHSVGFTGGEKIGDVKEVKYNISANYLNQEGMLKVNSQFQRYSLRANTDLKVSKRLSLAFDMNIIRKERDFPMDEGNVYFRIIHDNPPDFVPKFPDGTYGLSHRRQNALAALERARANTTTNYYYANVSANYEILEGLTLKGTIAPLSENVRYKGHRKSVIFTDYFTKEFVNQWIPNSIDERRDERLELYLQAVGQYEKTLGNHYVKALVGAERITNDFNWTSAGRTNAFSNELTSISAGSEETDWANGYEGSWKLASVFGRFNYDFQQKYLLEANFRYDGSSRFIAGGSRWDLFPSFSAGWNISKENFMQDVSMINLLKLRASWGELGNQNIGSESTRNTNPTLYGYLNTIGFGNVYAFNGSPVMGAYQNALGNEQLSWETSRIFDVGLDLTTFNGKLGLTADYYIKTNEDILYSIPIPAIIGLPAPNQNAFTMENRGWELALNHSNSVNDINYSAQLLLAENKNTIIDMKGAGPIFTSNGRTVRMEGQEIDVIYGFKTDGFLTQADLDNGYPTFRAGAKPGDLKFLDLDEDGDVDNDDKIVLGSAMPHYQLSLNLSAQYKNFDISAFFQGALKQQSILYGALIEGPNWENFTHVEMLGRWTAENPEAATWPRLERSSVRSQEPADFWLRDTRYVRLKNLQLGYTLPKTLLQRVGMETARFYLSGDNLLTISPEDYLDPEFPSGGRVTYYPQTQRFIFGVNLRF